MAKKQTDLMSSYHLYSALLAMKLLAMATVTCFNTTYFADKVNRASLNDLKHLTPFWLITALYISTNPSEATAICLMRAFVLARLVIAFSYLQRIPREVIQSAMCISFAVTGYMGAWVMYYYRDAI